MGVRLDEFDKAEWRDVVRIVRPDWSDEQFDAEWAGFQARKRRRAMH
ncbi:MAG: hypothetical protein V4808_07160 [Pseudomonadota bacterium]